MEFSVDEAVAAGATNVTFSKPVVSYLENFLNFPIGAHVPTGYYDRKRAAWIPSDSGVVIKILSTSGLADIDSNGDGVADNAAVLATLGVTDDERQTLAQLYVVGQTLWRVSVSHFTPWDMNWPYGPPSDAFGPEDPTDLDDDADDDPCEASGSIIDCQNRTLGESLPIAGSRFSLHYQSSRAPRAKAVTIHITGASTPASLKRVELEIDIAGRHITQTFGTAPNQTTVFTWDGKDAYGRDIWGTQPVTIRVGYVFNHVYQKSAESQKRAFAIPGTFVANYVLGREEFTLWRTGQAATGRYDLRYLGLGGWSLDAHHVFDPRSGVLYRGDGKRTRAFPTEVEVRTFSSDRPTRPASVLATYFPGGAPYRYRGHTVAADGSVYVSNYMDGYIYKISPAGVRTTIAGTGTQTNTGDGGPASAASVNRPGNIHMGPNGSLYIVTGPPGLLRKIDRNGIITTVAGGGTSTSDGIPATQTAFNGLFDVAVAPDGSFFVTEQNGCKLRRVGADGIISTYAGAGICLPGMVDVPATQTSIYGPTSLVLHPNGDVYFSQFSPGLVRRISPDGMLRAVAGSGSKTYSGDGGPAIDAGIADATSLALHGDALYVVTPTDGAVRKIKSRTISRVMGGTGGAIEGGPPRGSALSEPWMISFAPDGQLFFTSGSAASYNPLRVLTSHPRGSTSFINNYLMVPSRDGRELYRFDTRYRHLATLDALTGRERWRFTYDGQGRLASATDAHGNVTAVTHDGQGAPTFITSAAGATAVSVDGSGWLASVTRPGSSAVSLQTTTGGLLTSLTDASGGGHQFSYDAKGHLATDTNAAGETTTVAQTGANVSTLTRPSGLTTTYAQYFPLDGSARRHVVSTTGALSDLVVRTDGTRTLNLADGTIVSSVSAPDPRFGMPASYLSSSTVRLPSGLTQTVVHSRVVTASDLLSVQLQVDTTTVNGTRVYTKTYDGNARTITFRSAAGVVSTFTIDPSTAALSDWTLDTGVSPIGFTYDPGGNVVGIDQGALALAYSYNGKRRVVAEDLSGAATTYAYDAAGRVASVTAPSGYAHALSHDANGRVTSVTMPSGGVHQLTNDPRDLLSTYTPPGGPPTALTYDADGRIARFTLADGRNLATTYDAGGRVAQTVGPEATVSTSYVGNTRHPVVITRTPVVGNAQSITFAYDGSLVTGLTYAGPAVGTYVLQHDNNFFLTGISLDGGAMSPRTRDADGLLTGYGPFTVARSGPGRMISGITDGATTVATMTYDAVGRQTTRTVSAGGVKYSATLGYDNAGRLTTKNETVAGVAHTYVATYDADGQLTTVTRDGVVSEVYAYDVNGNRTSRQIGTNPAEVAAFDAQDRMTSRAGATYTWNAAGQMSGRGTDVFAYGAAGELLGATTGTGTSTYAYDGLGRRVAYTDGSGTYQYLYADDSFQVTHTRSPVGAITEYFYDDAGRLFALIRGGQKYFVGTDQVGTPRVVVDAAGVVQMSAEYDAFGVLFAGNPDAFDLPLGFAGGLRDVTTGFVRFGLRDYEPAAGRWTTRDPILFGGGQYNLYTYVANDPVLGRDPSGLAGCMPDPRSRAGAYAATAGYPVGTVGNAVHNAIGTIAVTMGTVGEERIGDVFNSPAAMALYNNPVNSASSLQIATMEWNYWKQVKNENPWSIGGQLGSAFSPAVRDWLQRNIFATFGLTPGGGGGGGCGGC